MQVAPFDLERWQSLHEHAVDINLSESGVHPLRVRELLQTGTPDALLALELGYTQTNGTVALRESIAGLYPGAGPDQILVTNGGSEANFITCWHLVEPGDEVVVVQPNYMQVPGVARSFGATVRAVWLSEGPERWELDLAAVRDAVGPRTRLIAVCNPNNPTGSRLRAAEVDELCAIAAEHGCWVLADEIYRDAELDGQRTTSAWGRYERVLVTGGLSKAYGLPGLRIGWVAGGAETIAALWGRRDYTSIAPGAVSDLLARVALADRQRLRSRTRRILLENQTRVATWVTGQPGLRQTPPEAGGVTLIRYAGSEGSTDLAETLRTEHGVLVVPGAHFGLEGCLRLGIGGVPGPLDDGLARLGRVLSAAT